MYFQKIGVINNLYFVNALLIIAQKEFLSLQTSLPSIKPFLELFQQLLSFIAGWDGSQELLHFHLEFASMVSPVLAYLQNNQQVYNLLSMSNKSFNSCFSAPSIRIVRKGRLLLEYGEAKQKARSQSLQQTFEKLPGKKMKMMLVKLGAVTQQENKVNLPSEEQRSYFRKQKYLQLKRFYQRRRYVNQRAYQSQLDEVVIDCYKPGQNRSSSQIWRDYRQNYKNLALRTQKVLNTRKFIYA